MKLIVLIVSLACAVVAEAERQPFDRYQSILDRQMFGPLPPGFDPTKLPSEVQKTSGSEKELTKEQERLQSAIHFSVIDVRPNGDVAVGFTDNSDPKAPRNYFLTVGESRDGWEVKAADPDAATMTIAKDDIEVSLTLGGNSAKDGNATAKAGASPATAAASGARRSGLLGGGLLGGSLRARRLQRKQEADAAAAQQREEQVAKDAERQAQAEQEKLQREQERAEQRQQLLAIQEELKRVREAKAAAESARGESDANNEAE